MPNIPFRFGAGRGLERSPSEQLQTGNLEFSEIDGEIRDVIQKRRGGVDVGLATSGSESLDPDALHALWYRNDEVVVEAAGSLYARAECNDNADLVERGPWTRTRLREIPGQTSAAELRAAALGSLNGCTLEAVEVVGSGILARVSGEGISAEFVVDADGTDCKIACLDATRLILSWVRDQGSASITIQRALWSPGDTGVTPVTVVDSVDLDGIDEQNWDLHADDTEGLAVWVWHASDISRRLAVEESGGTTFGFDGQAAIAASVVTQMDPRDAGVYVSRRTLGADEIRVQVVFAGILAGSNFAALLTSQWTHTLGVGIVEDDDQLVNFGAGPEIRAVAVGELLSEGAEFQRSMTEIIEATGERRVRLVRVEFGVGAATGRSWPRTVLATNAVNMLGRPVVVLQPVGDPLVNNTAIWVPMQSEVEVVARAWLSQIRDIADLSRQTTKMTISRFADFVACAIPGLLVAGISVPPRLSLGMTLDLTGRPNSPAVVDGVATSAHAGYPRVYDGADVYEQDWHVLPEIVSITPQGAGLPAGIYTVAVTWSWRDAQGLFYRSVAAVPGLQVFDSLGLDQALEYALLTHTERDEDRLLAEIWLTDPGGAELRLFAEAVAFTDDLAETNTILLNNPPAADAEVLDLAVIGGSQGRITDFLAAAGGRLWGRDPQFPSVARHSLFRVLNQGRSWDLLGLVGADGVEQEALTAIVELDGRVVLGSRTGWLRLDGTGPDNAGIGAYPPPIPVPASIGPEDQSVVAVYPDGVAFGTSRGPQLLSRGLSTQDLGNLVARQYDIEDGNIVAVVYDAVEANVIFGDDTQPTLLWNHQTARWVESPSRSCRDLGSSLTGRFAVLTTAGVILEYDVDTGLVFDAAQSILDALLGDVFCAPVGFVWLGGTEDILQAQPITPTAASTITDEFSGAFGPDAYDVADGATELWAVSGSGASAIADPTAVGTKWSFAAASKIQALSGGGGPLPSPIEILCAGDSVGARDNFAAEVALEPDTSVTTVGTLPSDLTPFNWVCYFGQSIALTGAEQTRLQDYMEANGGLLLCYDLGAGALAASVKAVVDAVSNIGAITVGTTPIPGIFSSQDYPTNTADALGLGNPALTLRCVGIAQTDFGFGVSDPSALTNGEVVFAGGPDTPVMSVLDETRMNTGVGRLVVAGDTDWASQIPAIADNQTFMQRMLATLPGVLSGGDTVLYSKRDASGVGWAISLVGGDFELSVSDGVTPTTVSTSLPALVVDDVIGIVLTIKVDDPNTTYTMAVATPLGSETVSIVTALAATNASTLRTGLTEDVVNGTVQSTDLLLAAPRILAATPEDAAVAVQAAAATGAGVTQFTRLTDGATPFATSYGTPWIRTTGADRRATAAFRFDALQILGECLGPHTLTIEKYDNFRNDAPTATATISLAEVMCLKNLGLPYQWAWNRQGDERLLATRFVIRDNSPPHASFRLEAVDVFVITEGSAQYAELQEEQQISDDT